MLKLAGRWTLEATLAKQACAFQILAAYLEAVSTYSVYTAASLARSASLRWESIRYRWASRLASTLRSVMTQLIAPVRMALTAAAMRAVRADRSWGVRHERIRHH